MAPVVERESFRRRVDDAVVVLFALVSETVGWATVALLDQDVDLANRVIAEDRGIDERCEELAASLKERSVGGIVEAVGEVESQRDDDEKGQTESAHDVTADRALGGGSGRTLVPSQERSPRISPLR